MALTVTRLSDPDGTDLSAGTYLLACDNSYPSGGYPLTPAMFGRKALHSVIPIQVGTASRIITYDPTGGLQGLLRVWTAIGTEAVAATDQSSVSCRVRVVGPLA